MTADLRREGASAHAVAAPPSTSRPGIKLGLICPDFSPSAADERQGAAR